MRDALCVDVLLAATTETATASEPRATLASARDAEADSRTSYARRRSGAGQRGVPMENGEKVASNIRSSILKHLQLLADMEAQRVYERRVPIADVPAELVCGWFDDLYHPQTSVFLGAFTPSELAVLAEFNDLFDAALAGLPEQLPALSDLQARPDWGRVVVGAAAALRALSAGAA